MNQDEILHFIKELSRLPLGLTDLPSIRITHLFPESNTIQFIITDDAWGQELLVSAEKTNGFKKLLKYVQGTESSISMEDLDVINKIIQVTFKIGLKSYNYRITPLFNSDKELIQKIQKLGSDVHFVPIKQ